MSMKQSANSSIISASILRKVLRKAINKSGDSMTGELSMSDNKITNVASGVDETDAVNVGQLNEVNNIANTNENNINSIKDGSIELPYVKKNGDTMTGELAMSNNKITGLADGVNDDDAVTVKQLNAATPDIPYMTTSVAGIAKVGANLFMSDDGTLNAVAQGGDKTYVAGDGISITVDPSEENISTIAVDNTVAKISDVDNKIAEIKTEVDENVGNIAGNSADISKIVDGTTELPYVKKSGDTMSGTLSMGGYNITNVANPTTNKNAANKEYVDAGDTVNASGIAKNAVDIGNNSAAITKNTNDIEEIKENYWPIGNTSETDVLSSGKFIVTPQKDYYGEPWFGIAKENNSLRLGFWSDNAPSIGGRWSTQDATHIVFKTHYIYLATSDAVTVRITSVALPQIETDVANKNYVDTRMSSVASLANAVNTKSVAPLLRSFICCCNSWSTIVLCSVSVEIRVSSLVSPVLRA
ncbi:MAG: coiled stalk of trimeric autotransporter [Circular genetic element sp.]|nr:MAG: coiled stalk of trimeric autotransporter [Circular genetic element sp.]